MSARAAPLIEAAALVDGRLRGRLLRPLVLVLLRTDERVRAYMNVCTHLGGPLEVSANGSTFQCQWHGACFDARTGKASCAPARADTHLMRLPVKIDDGRETLYIYGEADHPADTEVDTN